MVNWSKFLIIFVFLGLAVSLLYLGGIYFSLFWLMPWFDIPMHILGGFWVMLLAFVIFHHFKQSMLGTFSSFFVLILGTMIIGILWEIFEYHFDISDPGKMGYVVDTTKDLADDFLGGTLGFFYLKHFFNRGTIPE